MVSGTGVCVGGQGNEGWLLLCPSVLIVEESLCQESTPLTDCSLLLVGQNKKASGRRGGWKNEYLTFQTLL